MRRKEERERERGEKIARLWHWRLVCYLFSFYFLTSYSLLAHAESGRCVRPGRRSKGELIDKMRKC